MNKILEINNLYVEFTLRDKVLKVLRNISFNLYENEVLAIVGESGSGKSVLTKSIVGMLDKNGRITKGSIDFKGEMLTEYKEKQWLDIRGKRISFVFQDPLTSLNPLKKIGQQLCEILKLHRGMSRYEAKEEALNLLKEVGISEPERRFNQYPFEFSGGMRQRVVIAIAIACKPEILICDEPTTALDVTIQAQILKLLKALRKKFNMSIIFITHDLGVVANIADRVNVMYAGEIVEYGNVEEIFFDARSPYTLALLKSLPQLGRKGAELFSIKGTPPNLYNEIIGDPFAPRNEFALNIDFIKNPPLKQISNTHYAKTWLLDERAPEIERFNYLKKLTENEKENQIPLKKKRILTVKNLDVFFGNGRKKFHAIKDVSFDVYKGETFALVGESGSGKTTIGRTIIGENSISNGDILFEGNSLKGKRDRELYKKIQMIFQDPQASLNERAKIEYIIAEGLIAYYGPKEAGKHIEKIKKILDEVKLPQDALSRFPHEFSGGQRQRVGIARALVMEPSFVIADEPISALDVSIRAGVINLLNKLKEKYDTTYLFIAHDLSIVKFIADRIGILYKGKLVEVGTSYHIFNNPLHCYTKSLLSAIPEPNPKTEKNKEIINFHMEFTGEEKLTEIEEGHFILK